MKSKSGGVPGVWRAFTLIELLIVVAIIAILAAIAVPNFLEAQTRSKVARAMSDMRTVHMAISAYTVDYNTCLRDWNDSDWPASIKNQMGFYEENPGAVSDLTFRGTDPRGWTARFYSTLAMRPLTTPTAYISSGKFTDTFSHLVPFGMDTREQPTGSIAYWVLLSAGPDRTDGDWYRGNNPETASSQRPGGTSIKSDPTNGTVSKGDIWRGEAFTGQALYNQEYVYPM